MVISRKTLIIDLLKTEKDAVLGRLTQLSPNFSRLRNPVLRNLFARFVDIEGACKVAGCELSAFLAAMQEIGFTVQDAGEDTVEPATELTHRSGGSVQVLDVRPILADKKDPIQLILKHIDQLKDNESLKLIAPFEPVPLIHMLASRGFTHFVEREEGSVITYFEKNPEAAAHAPAPAAVASATSEAQFDDVAGQYKGRLRTIDVRQLDMPQPMIMILENLESLRSDEALFVYHKKLPVYLMPHLRERGFEHVTQHTADGKLNLIIYRP